MEPLTNISLTGKTALITGGARRLGAAIAQGLAQAGTNVVIHFNQSEADAVSLADTLGKQGVQAWTVQADLQNEAEVGGLIDKAAAMCASIDFLINNASVFEESSLDTVDEMQLLKNMKINAWAPLILARNFSQVMPAGAIINMLDTKVLGYDREHLAYHLSKRCLNDSTKILATELAPDFRVNAVAPGLVLGPSGKGETYLKDLADTVPLQGYSGPEAVVEAVLFLLRSAFITGQTIYIDGGRHLHGSFYG